MVENLTSQQKTDLAQTLAMREGGKKGTSIFFGVANYPGENGGQGGTGYDGKYIKIRI